MLFRSEPYTNKDGDEATLYGAQIYLLLGGYKSEEEARDTLSQWQEMAKAQYAVDETSEKTHNGRDYHIITYNL